MRKVRYTIAIEDENGNVISETKYSKECDIPTKDEIDRHTYLGLLTDVDKIEKALVGTRTEAEKAAMAYFLKETDDKKTQKAERCI